MGMSLEQYAAKVKEQEAALAKAAEEKKALEEQNKKLEAEKKALEEQNGFKPSIRLLSNGCWDVRASGRFDSKANSVMPTSTLLRLAPLFAATAKWATENIGKEVEGLGRKKLPDGKWVDVMEKFVLKAEGNPRSNGTSESKSESTEDSKETAKKIELMVESIKKRVPGITPEDAMEMATSILTRK